MLAMVIEDRKNNSWSELFLNDNKLSGFSVTNGIISQFNRDYLSVFDAFLLSDEREKMESIDSYEVLKDKKTGFYHFFKDGKEDYNKFFLYNSTDANLYIFDNGKVNSRLRKFFLGLASISLIIDLSFLGYVISDNNKEELDFYDVSYNIQEIKKSTFDNISYHFEEIGSLVKREVLFNQIYNLINSSENLNQIEKDFLWNPELIKMVSTYYAGTNFEAVSLSRHNGLKIESFTEEEREGSNGYYAYDNVLHLKDYDVKNIEEGNDQCRDAGHEYIHMLQVSSCPAFIMEASAEVMSHEFYLNSSDMSEPFAYPNACKYLKILMEIVGPEVIIESNFSLYSTSLEDAVRDYFSEEEFNEFFYIMNLSPFYDVDELNQGKYQRLEELLNVLYNNKYGEDMTNDNMVRTILSSGKYNRPYFRESLINSSQSYYVTKNYINVDEAKEDDIYECVYEKNITREEFFGKHQDEEVRLVRSVPLIDVESSSIIIDGYNDITGGVILKSGEILEMKEAESMGIVRIEYISRKGVSLEEFLSNYKTDNDYKCKVKMYVESINEKLSNDIKLS